MEEIAFMIEMLIESVVVNPVTEQRMLILKARDQDRYLFLKIAHPEAYAIAIHLQEKSSHPPLTHDLMKNLVEEMGANVIRVMISGLIDDIFTAQMVLDVASQEKTIDARAGDALALAVRTNAPVFVAEQVLEQRGIDPEQDDDAEASSSEQQKAERKQVRRHLELREVLSLTNEVTMLKEQLAQVEEELRKAKARIAELEST